MFTDSTDSPRRLLAPVTIAIALIASARAASAQDGQAAPNPKVFATVVAINRKALDDYDNLNFEEAHTALQSALALCAGNGLGHHPVRAQTYLNLGVVLLAADAKHPDIAVAQFRRALQIQSDIRPAERVANPEVQQAFAQAKAEVDADTARSRQLTGATIDDPRPTSRTVTISAPRRDSAGPVVVAGVAAAAGEPSDARWRFAFSVGSGVGWASGTGEVNTDVTLPSGFRLSSRLQLSPAIGYFVLPSFLLSLQGRFQLISGATAERDPTRTMCGADHVCSASTGASAVFIVGSWFLGQGQGVLRPYVSGALGYGQIRHLVSLPGDNDCGADPAHPVACVDTTAAGPVFIGPGAGVVFRLAPHFAFTLGASSLVGFSSFTFHVDVSGGVAVDL